MCITPTFPSTFTRLHASQRPDSQSALEVTVCTFSTIIHPINCNGRAFKRHACTQQTN
eukprot:m.17956 g.17956  ORF g.17956 m.17956 type:complete len:58 (+) comp7621_c0_seq1:2325-2498(+)